ncbi:MAG: SagB/ThcOx family dehydrogenase [Candidatus Omnitrophota bacterium]
MKSFRVCLITFIAVVFMAASEKVSAQEAQSPISLLKPNFALNVSLMKALSERKSTREFKADDLSLQMISNLLWAATGINRPDSGMRTAPSAKNAQEIDVYVAMKTGLYLYNAKAHALDPILPKDIRPLVGIQDFVQQAPIGLIFVSNLDRLGGPEEIAMFYSATDTGYISQNVYLYCASEGLATVVLGWMDKEALAKAMSLKPTQRIMLTQPVGYPK